MAQFLRGGGGRGIVAIHIVCKLLYKICMGCRKLLWDKLPKFIAKTDFFSRKSCPKPVRVETRQIIRVFTGLGTGMQSMCMAADIFPAQLAPSFLGCCAASNDFRPAGVDSSTMAVSTPTCRLNNTHTHTHARTHARTHAETHTQTYSHRHTHTHTHTHTPSRRVALGTGIHLPNRRS